MSVETIFWVGKLEHIYLSLQKDPILKVTEVQLLLGLQKHLYAFQSNESKHFLEEGGFDAHSFM